MVAEECNCLLLYLSEHELFFFNITKGPRDRIKIKKVTFGKLIAGLFHHNFNSCLIFKHICNFFETPCIHLYQNIYLLIWNNILDFRLKNRSNPIVKCKSYPTRTLNIESILPELGIQRKKNYRKKVPTQPDPVQTKDRDRVISGCQTQTQKSAVS